MKKKNALILTLVVVALLVGGYFLMNLEYGKSITMEMVVDPSIDQIDLYSLDDPRETLLTIKPKLDGMTKEVTLKVYQKPFNFASRPVLQHYTFLMKKGEESFQGDSFNLYNRASRIRMNIGQAGHWEIVNR
jgi:hypothetical protein